MIRVSNLSFQYPRSDFKLSVELLQVANAEKVAIVGPSGSGKTTLLNLICGIELPGSGIVEVDGVTVSGLNESARRDFRIQNIGMVFQQFELVDYLNTRDNILVPFDINSSLARNKSLTEKSFAIASEVGLGDKMRRYPNQLSQGEQQRVAICRAMVTNPKLLLADEPTGNLDPVNKSRIMDLLFEQVEEAGRTLVVVTHDMTLLDGFDRVIDFENFRQSTGLESGNGLA